MRVTESLVPGRWRGLLAGPPQRWRGLPRRTIRLRLTLVYGGLFLLSGAVLLLITYVLVANRLPNVTGARVLMTAPSSQPVQIPSGEGVYYAGNGTCGTAGSPATLPPTPGQERQQFGQCLAQQRKDELNQLLAESGIALAIMTVASVGLGWLVAGRVLRPLRTITGAARTISASSLHSRLAMPGPDDELKELGDTFDGLLARLEASFSAQRQFVANASHELRTPLARQRTLVEVALADPEPTVATLRAACERVLAAGEQQERLIEALLTLARSQRGLDRREPVDLSPVVSEVLSARQPAAKCRQLDLTAALEPALVLGDPRLVERLVANLADNAIAHNSPGGWVQVGTGIRAGRAVLAIANSGPVIPGPDVGRLFEPFERLGNGRAASRDGLGLGLSIVGAIAVAHAARVRAAALPGGGLEIEVDFPGPGAPPGGSDGAVLGDAVLGDRAGTLLTADPASPLAGVGVPALAGRDPAADRR
jgi:signal transduction histidine kinase